MVTRQRRGNRRDYRSDQPMSTWDPSLNYDTKLDDKKILVLVLVLHNSLCKNTNGKLNETNLRTRHFDRTEESAKSKIALPTLHSCGLVDYRKAELVPTNRNHRNFAMTRPHCLIAGFLFCSLTGVIAFAPFPTSPTSLTTAHATAVDTSFMWNRGLSFGKGQFKFYEGFDKWMSVFPEEDRQAYPDVFNYPTGVYEVRLRKPLGIVFEEIEMGKGLYVKELVTGGNAASQGDVKEGDVLVGITAVKVVGAKYERRLIPARNFDFDTMVGAVESNDSRFNCQDVVLAFERPDESNSAETDKFMEFFEPPFDNPWKQPQ